jgi:hypothetical protein
MGDTAQDQVSVTHRLLGWGLVAAGAAILISPVRRHRAVWHVTVGDRPPERRVLRGGGYMPSARVMLDALRSGGRRPDAAFRTSLGVALIGSGLGLSLIPGEP